MTYDKHQNLKTGRRTGHLNFSTGKKIFLNPVEQKEFELWVKTKQWKAFLEARTT